MHVTFAKDLGLTCRLFKFLSESGKNIGPAAAGPAGPVPVPLEELKSHSAKCRGVCLLQRESMHAGLAVVLAVM